jgi:hypothetical protein
MRVDKKIYCRRTSGRSRTVRYFYTKKPLMKTFFSASTLRLALVLALGAGTATVLTTACTKDPEPVVFKDYSGIDDDIIKKYIADSTITGAQKQPSGLYYVPVVTNAAGAQAMAKKTATVKYAGKFIDGRVFDSGTFSFVLGATPRLQVIPGFDEGITLMRVGEKAKLLIPSKLAYGPSGNGPIAANTVIRFDVELTALR